MRRQTYKTLTTVSTKYLIKRSKRTAIVCITLFGLTLIGCGNSEPAQAVQTHSTSPNSSAIGVSGDAAMEPSLKSDPKVVTALQNNLSASGIYQTIKSAVPTDMPDMYWVTAEGMPNFITNAQGDYIIQGTVIKIGSDDPYDITAKLQANMAKTLLAQVDKSDMIIYPAIGETKAAVYVFTDADCGYCRKLHSEMGDINARGIEVRYLAWPRSPQTLPKMEAIWCSDDRNVALDKAKAGGNIVAHSCDNPVAEQTELGFSLGVNGTPAIFTQSGAKIGGYIPARQLAEAAIANQ